MPLSGGKIYFQIAAFFLSELTLGKSQQILIHLGRLVPGMVHKDKNNLKGWKNSEDCLSYSGAQSLNFFEKYILGESNLYI
jgi:hypothetical protein